MPLLFVINLSSIFDPSPLKCGKSLQGSSINDVINFSLILDPTPQKMWNALAWVQQVHKPADLWDITFCTPLIFGLLVCYVCAPTDF